MTRENPELHGFWGHKLEKLIPRELEVLKYTARGLDHHDISKALDITWGTVKNHRANLYKKLGAHSGLEAVLRALSAPRNIFSISELVDVKRAEQNLRVLTEDQKEVLKAMYEILPMNHVNQRAVARKLEIPLGTLAGRRIRMYRKLGVSKAIPALLMVMAAEREKIVW